MAWDLGLVALLCANALQAAAQAPAWQCSPTGSGAVSPALTEAATDYLRRVEEIYPRQVLGLVRAGDRYYLLNSRDVEWIERMRLHLLALRLREAYLSPERQAAGAVPGSSPPRGDFTCLAASRAEREGLTSTRSGELVLAGGQSVHLINPQEPEVAVEVRAARDRPLAMGDILQRSARAGIYAGLTGQAAMPPGAATIETPEATVILRTASVGSSAAPLRGQTPKEHAVVNQPVDFLNNSLRSLTPKPPVAAPEPLPAAVVDAPPPAAAPPVEVAVVPVTKPTAPEPKPVPVAAAPEPYEDYAKAMKTLMALKRSRGVLSVGEMTYVHPAVELLRGR